MPSFRTADLRSAARSRRSLATAALGAIACTLAIAPPCRADAGDLAAAQSLFEAGKQAMAAKDYATACPKLAESFRLDPAGGTALALALCDESWGKTATAWADFNQALAIARRDRRTEREQAAQQHIAALEKRLVKVKLVVNDDAPSLEVHRDGTLVGRAQWGIAVPVDPGAHVYDAKADKKKAWKSDVTTGAEGTTVDVVVPALESEAPPPPASASVAPPVPPPTSSAPPASSAIGGSTASERSLSPPPVEDPGATRKTIAYVVGGVGVVGLGTGTVLGLMASSKWTTAKNACPNATCKNASDQQAGKDAGGLADGATVAFVIGGALVAAGAVIYFTAPSSLPNSNVTGKRLQIAPMVGRDGAGISIGGAL